MDGLYFQIWTVLSHIFFVCGLNGGMLSIVGLFENGTAVCLYEWVRFYYFGLSLMSRENWHIDSAGSNCVICSLVYFNECG